MSSLLATLSLLSMNVRRPTGPLPDPVFLWRAKESVAAATAVTFTSEPGRSGEIEPVRVGKPISRSLAPRKSQSSALSSTVKISCLLHQPLIFPLI
ncbi:hypothetical protein R1flu_013243 [Riccia fluitans]|uniref:Secreted protein n=1 Tax=Riccia fluitans TaxID=41844 RepID=A0ABD1YFW2_9MARC